jgi:hypothetical protein
MFLEDAVASHAGKTIDELFPDEPTSNQTDFSVTPQIIAELKARTQHREKFTLMYSASSGAAFQGTTNADEDAFAFSVLWTAEQPELARVSLHRYAFESLQTRGPLHYLVMDRLGVGDSVRFSVS